MYFHKPSNKQIWKCTKYVIVPISVLIASIAAIVFLPIVAFVLLTKQYRKWRGPFIEWSKWFAWYPVPVQLHPQGPTVFIWMERVERKWGSRRKTFIYRHCIPKLYE